MGGTVIGGAVGTGKGVNVGNGATRDGGTVVGGIVGTSVGCLVGTAVAFGRADGTAVAWTTWAVGRAVGDGVLATEIGGRVESATGAAVGGDTTGDGMVGAVAVAATTVPFGCRAMW